MRRSRCPIDKSVRHRWHVVNGSLRRTMIRSPGSAKFSCSALCDRCGTPIPNVPWTGGDFGVPHSRGYLPAIGLLNDCDEQLIRNVIGL